MDVVAHQLLEISVGSKNLRLLKFLESWKKDFVKRLCIVRQTILFRGLTIGVQVHRQVKHQLSVAVESLTDFFIINCALVHSVQ